MKKLHAKNFWVGIACSALLIALFSGLAYTAPQQTDQSQQTKQTASSVAGQQRNVSGQAVTKGGTTNVEQRLAAMEEKLTRIEGKVDQLYTDLHKMWRELWGMIDRLPKK